MSNDMIARLEAATGDQQHKLLLEAWGVIHPEPPIWGKEDWNNWWNCKRRFIKMLNAEAYESAALTLVPEGCTISLNIDRDSQSEVTLESGWDAFVGYAATPALAICIAALKAKGAADAPRQARRQDRVGE